MGQFGTSGAWGIATSSDEIFVCDKSNDRIRVFSLGGELLRDIEGEWRAPIHLLFFRDRLYLVEDNDTEEERGEKLERGKRIFVLTTAGEPLQKYVVPSDSIGDVDSIKHMHVLGNKLLVSLRAPGCSKSSTFLDFITLKGI